LRQPAIYTLADGLERMRRENHQIWSFLTLDGTLWSEEMAGVDSGALQAGIA
jgi:hypothetical protein